MYHSPLEIALVLLIVLILFGPKRIPDLGRAVGKGVRNFRGAMSGEHDAGHGASGELEQRRLAVDEARAKLAAAEASAEKPVEGEVVTEHKG
jgi:sec-independent protein translocase protein TatA